MNYKKLLGLICGGVVFCWLTGLFHTHLLPLTGKWGWYSGWVWSGAVTAIILVGLIMLVLLLKFVFVEGLWEWLTE